MKIAFSTRVVYRGIQGFSTDYMMTASNGNFFRFTGPLCGNSPVTGEFPSQRSVMQSFDVFFDLDLNKRSSKQSRRRWSEMPSLSSWRYCNSVCSVRRCGLTTCVLYVSSFLDLYVWYSETRVFLVFTFNYTQFTYTYMHIYVLLCTIDILV